MSGAILITKYWENCVACPCCTMTEYAIYCNALTREDMSEKMICNINEYYNRYSHTAPRPEWCPLIEVGG